MQATGPAVVGTIRDGVTGEPLAGAVVALPDIDRSTVSASNGRYALMAVPPGPQHLTVRLLGYAPRVLHALVPREGQLEINIALHAEAYHLTAIEVRSPVPVRGAEGGDSLGTDRTISIAAIRNDPLLSEPDGLRALSGGDIALNPETPSGVNIRGGASDQTAYLLDDIPVLSPYHAAGMFSAWNPDALDRLRVFASFPSAASPEALSGTVSAVTREPGARMTTQGAVSTTQARATLDGPLGFGSAGFLLSLRSSLPTLGTPEDPTYLARHAHDALAKLELPAAGGWLRLLGYDSGNEIDAVAALARDDSTTPPSAVNAFEWHSRSIGAGWSGRVGGTEVRLDGWQAVGDADVTWHLADATPARMTSHRNDEGLVVVGERRAPGRSTLAGIRLQWSRTSYRVAPVDGAPPSLRLRAETPVTTLFVEHQRVLDPRVTANIALAAAGAAGTVWLAPRVRLGWTPTGPLTLTASYARTQQFSQSARNPESVVGNIFPADAYVGAGDERVPVAEGDLGVLAADYRPASGIRLGAQVYLRDLTGLLLVAPSTGEPFATDGFAIGSAVSRGLALEAAVSGARYGLLASYGWQYTRMQHDATSYVPAQGSAHTLEAGVTVFPSATTSLRVGLTGELGRRGTPVDGPFEWEACNLLDRGCEFGGSPRYQPGQLATGRLPAYYRLDLGVRKHWHLEVAGRDVQLGVFGTLTNLLGRSNLLTRSRGPGSAGPGGIEMLPFAPLVVGLDWRF